MNTDPDFPQKGTESAEILTANEREFTLIVVRCGGENAVPLGGHYPTHRSPNWTLDTLQLSRSILALPRRVSPAPFTSKK